MTSFFCDYFSSSGVKLSSKPNNRRQTRHSKTQCFPLKIKQRYFLLKKTSKHWQSKKVRVCVQTDVVCNEQRQIVNSVQTYLDVCHKTMKNWHFSSKHLCHTMSIGNFIIHRLITNDQYIFIFPWINDYLITWSLTIHRSYWIKNPNSD